MRIHNVQQGGQDWLALRADPRVCTASEAPAMMGESKYKTRTALLREKATGVRSEVDSGTQARFDAGHRAEAAFRPHAEMLIGDELYPVTGTDDIDGMTLLASFDGMTMAGDILFEHKLWSADLAGMIERGELGPNWTWQLEHQLLVSGADRALFVTSDGTTDQCRHMWYTSVPARRAALIAGWRQFLADLDVYVHEEQAPVVVASPIMDLPAVNVNIEGALQVLSNLPEFGGRLRAFIDGLNPAPESDQDFADAENEVKVLKRAEDELQAAEDRALAQISVVDEMRKMKAMLHKLARDTRLAREKLVKDRKEVVRAKIQGDATAQIKARISAIDARLGGAYLPAIPHDIAGSMKGKKSIASLRDAAACAVAAWKIEADRVAGIIEKNLETLDANGEYSFLFSDRHALVLKDPEAVAAIAGQRIAQHEAALQRQAEEAAERERERIRAEERARAEADAKARESAERAERERAEREAAATAEAAVSMPAQQIISAPAAQVTTAAPTPITTAPAAHDAPPLPERPSPVREWADPIEEADVQATPAVQDPVETFLDSREWQSPAARKAARALLTDFVSFTRQQRAA